MNVWFIQQHRSDQENTSILIYSTREGAEKAVRKYIKDYLNEGYDFKDFYAQPGELFQTYPKPDGTILVVDKDKASLGRMEICE